MSSDVEVVVVVECHEWVVVGSLAAKPAFVLGVVMCTPKESPEPANDGKCGKGTDISSENTGKPVPRFESKVSSLVGVDDWMTASVTANEGSGHGCKFKGSAIPYVHFEGVCKVAEEYSAEGVAHVVVNGAVKTYPMALFEYTEGP